MTREIVCTTRAYVHALTQQAQSRRHTGTLTFTGISISISGNETFVAGRLRPNDRKRILTRPNAWADPPNIFETEQELGTLAPRITPVPPLYKHCLANM